MLWQTSQLNTDQVLNGNTDLTFRDFKVMGAANRLPQGPNSLQDAPLVPAIRLRIVDRFHFENVEISHAPGISLIYQGSSNGLVRDNYIHNSGTSTTPVHPQLRPGRDQQHLARPEHA